MRFLMIDDDDSKVDKMKEFFQGYEFERAKSYQSGLWKLINEKYDGLILDMMFPYYDDEPWKICHINGINVLLEMERRGLEIPTVVFSSGVTDVSGYENVKGYILNGVYSIEEDVLKFIDYCDKNKEGK